MTSAPVLVVEHEQQCPAGFVGEWLAAAGCRLDVRRPYLDEELSADLSGHAGMLVLGGSMGACDDATHPWLTRVKDLVRTAAADRVPVLGLCLGHQLASVALGGTVARNPGGQQVGVLPMGWLPAARHDPLLRHVYDAPQVVQWNDDVVTSLPADAELLAATAAGQVQAARLAETVWGLQGHPEVGAAILATWAANDRDDAAERGVDVDAHVAEVAAAEQRLRGWWRPLGEGFVQLLQGAEAIR